MSVDPTKQSQLEAIAQRIVADDVCPELKAGAKQLVFADGNPDADIVFIGEAPGQREDELGLPFVGAAGKFLDEMLAQIGLKRADIYITNVVKYRPPNNRDPEPEEKAAFMPYLFEQLAVIQPKLVVFLGRHAMNVFFPQLSISNVHGKVLRSTAPLPRILHSDAAQGAGEELHQNVQSSTEREHRSLQRSDAPKASGGATGTASGQASAMQVPWVYLALYHPAAALYNGGMRSVLEADFAKIPAIIAKTDQQQNTTKKTNAEEPREPEAQASLF